MPLFRPQISSASKSGPIAERTWPPHQLRRPAGPPRDLQEHTFPTSFGAAAPADTLLALVFARAPQPPVILDRGALDTARRSSSQTEEGYTLGSVHKAQFSIPSTTHKPCIGRTVLWVFVGSQCISGTRLATRAPILELGWPIPKLDSGTPTSALSSLLCAGLLK